MAKDEEEKVKDDVKDEADTTEAEAEEKAETKESADDEKAEAKDEASSDEKAEAKDEASSDDEEDESSSDEKAEAKDDEDEDEDEDEVAPKGDRVVGASPYDSAEVHGEAYDGAVAAAKSEHAHDEIAHVTPVSLLFKVWGALMVFTVLTVAASYIDFGGQTNLVVAMLIATCKASLVVVFFMHLRWDRRFHALTFLSGFLFVILFIGIVLTDRSEYQPMIKAYQDAQAKVHGGVRLGPQP